MLYMSDILDKSITIIWLGQILVRTSSPRVTFLKKKKCCLILGDFGPPLISCLGLLIQQIFS